MVRAAADHLLTSHLAAGRLPGGLAAAGQAGGGATAAGRIVLVAVAVLAVTAFAALQVRARRRGTPDWRTPPSRYGQQPRRDEAPGGNDEQHRPDWCYGYPPGRDQGRDRGVDQGSNRGWTQAREPGRRERGSAS